MSYEKPPCLTSYVKLLPYWPVDEKVSITDSLVQVKRYHVRRTQDEAMRDVWSGVWAYSRSNWKYSAVFS